MQFSHIGRSGLEVSRLCLGAMTFGRETSKKDSLKMMDMFKDRGGNFIDTANVYSQGLSEEIVGEWLGNQNREDWVIATKVRFPMGDGPNHKGLGRKHIFSSIQDSLDRLGTDYVDILYVHAWDYNTRLEETLSTLSSVVESGMARYIGVSNHSGWQLQRALDVSEFRDLEPYIILQAKYNLLIRETEWELLPVVKNHGMGFVAWGPLFGGWLSGRYTRDMSAPPRGSRVETAEEKGWFESWSRYNRESTWKVIDEVLEVARETGKSPAQVSLNWLLQKPITGPIIGASKIHHLEDNLDSAEWQLSAEHMARLDEISRPELPYPYDFLEMAKGV
ncbi:aldo/keto reductase [Salinispira pacifica]|nr:aldo/keto reductase [Salinispira pacifica]